MNALITGIEGFTGKYLAAELNQAGHEVIGLAFKPQIAAIPGVKTVYACDLCDVAGLGRVINEVQPDMVAHLAGISFVAHGDVEAIYRSNLIGSRNLLEALSRSGKALRSVLLASSANIYGNATGGVLDESTPPAPANDYAVSKLAMEYMAKLYFERLPITIVRPFNYTGAGQAEDFLLPKIVSHVKRRAAVIELGNLDVSRDFSDVRTVARYYRLLMENPVARSETYNVCSGKAYSLEEVLGMVNSLTTHRFAVRVNPDFVRENEVKKLIGSRAKLEATVDGAQDIPLVDTLRWMIETTQ